MNKDERHLVGWLADMAMWDDVLCWKTIQDGQAHAKTPLGTYVVEVRPGAKSYTLRLVSPEGERECQTRFTATNRVAWEAEDHYRRLQARPPSRMKAPSW